MKVHAHPLSAYYIMYKVTVYAPAEWADTLALFHLYKYIYSVGIHMYYSLQCIFIEINVEVHGPLPSLSRWGFG